MDCTKELFVGINVTSDEKGNFYLDQKKLIECTIKAAKVSGAKVQKLPYPLDGPSLSKADNAKTEAEANDMATLVIRISRYYNIFYDFKMKNLREV